MCQSYHSYINFTAIDPEDDETVAMIKELLETRIRYLFQLTDLFFFWWPVYLQGSK